MSFILINRKRIHYGYTLRHQKFDTIKKARRWLEANNIDYRFLITASMDWTANY